VRFVVDMNLSALWTAELAKDGHDAVHWSFVGAADASDDEILAWAANEGRVVMTADLDFGVAVATRRLTAPSVVQIRDANTDPDAIGPAVRLAIKAAGAVLIDGAILTINRHQARIRPGPQAHTLTDDI
jgi:predicted nuclease of predicted toxin-antitoxin system